MRFLIGILFCLHFAYQKARAQDGNFELGARSMGISGSSITISDAYAGFNNIGALAGQKGISACFSSSILYGIPELLKIGFALNTTLFKGVGSLNMYRFGNGNLSEQKISLGYGHQIRFISLGIQLGYIQHLIPDYSSAGSVSFEFGGLIKFSSKIIMGGYLLYPLKSGQKPDYPGFLSTILKTGLSYRPSEYLMANIEYKWKYSAASVVTVGFEYMIRGKLAIRTGFNMHTLQSTMGIGFRPGRFRLDYAILIHPLLGISNELSVIVSFTNP
jgi:hypothetical protein